MQCVTEHLVDIMMAMCGLHAMWFVAALRFSGSGAGQQVLVEFMSGVQRHCSDMRFDLWIEFLKHLLAVLLWQSSIATDDNVACNTQAAEQHLGNHAMFD